VARLTPEELEREIQRELALQLAAEEPDPTRLIALDRARCRDLVLPPNRQGSTTTA
jgi:hypothetical protein